jgi:hypothetical protein
MLTFHQTRSNAVIHSSMLRPLLACKTLFQQFERSKAICLFRVSACGFSHPIVLTEEIISNKSEFEAPSRVFGARDSESLESNHGTTSQREDCSSNNKTLVAPTSLVTEN